MNPAPPDLSPLSLFLKADPVVQAVMAAARARLRRLLGRHHREGRRARPAEARGAGPWPRMRRPATSFRRSAPGASRACPPRCSAPACRMARGAGEPRRPLASSATGWNAMMRVAVAATLRTAEPGLPLLATIGSVAPFVGLFGTVWGIMNSFSGIAAEQDTAPRRRRAGHRRGAVRHRHRPGRRHPGGASPTTAAAFSCRRIRAGGAGRRREPRQPAGPAPRHRRRPPRRGGVAGMACSPPATTDDDAHPISEINVTPLVDVMLVLLVDLHGDRADADGRRAGGPAAHRRRRASARRAAAGAHRGARRPPVPPPGGGGRGRPAAAPARCARPRRQTRRSMSAATASVAVRRRCCA